MVSFISLDPYISAKHIHEVNFQILVSWCFLMCKILFFLFISYVTTSKVDIVTPFHLTYCRGILQILPEIHFHPGDKGGDDPFKPPPPIS